MGTASGSKMEANQSGPSEVDWYEEHTINCGSVGLRVWPAQCRESLQAQWAAVDVWIAMRESSTLATAKERQKSSHLAIH